LSQNFIYITNYYLLRPYEIRSHVMDSKIQTNSFLSTITITITITTNIILNLQSTTTKKQLSWNFELFIQWGKHCGQSKLDQLRNMSKTRLHIQLICLFLLFFIFMTFYWSNNEVISKFWNMLKLIVILMKNVNSICMTIFIINNT
jgi:hypothetical protein